MQHSRRPARATLVTLGAVALAGLIDLPLPLEGDQSLFLIGARAMARGAVLYRDFWDLKQPGIYVAYYVAGRLGGFDALAVHALELVLLLVFTFALIVAFARSPAFARAPARAALLCVAPYYIVTSSLEQTQVESLAGVPLFLCAWFACEGIRHVDRTRSAFFAAAGVAAGAALMLKLLFAPLVLAMLVTAVARPNGAYRPRARDVFFAALACAAGAALPLGATLAALAHGDALGAALTTWFADPPRIVATLPAQSPRVLFASLEKFAYGFAPLLVLGAAGLVSYARSRTPDPLARCLAVWLVAGALTIAVQRTSWYAYQGYLECVPLGAFAAYGFVALLRTPRTFARGAVLALAALCAVLPARIEARKIVALAHFGGALDARNRERFRADASPYSYAGFARDASLLPAHASLYVFGNPMYYVLTDRLQPLALNGWSTQLLLPEQRTELLREFRANPPQYVYRSNDDDGFAAMLKRSPAFAAYFTRAYRATAHGTYGTLYRATSTQDARTRARTD